MKTIVIAPHPDDETLGCGGTLFRRKFEGHEIAWVIVTKMTNEAGWSCDSINRRNEEIEKISNFFSFDKVFSLGFQTMKLDQTPFGDIVSSLAVAFEEFKPDEVLLPHRGDAHSDHRIVFDATTSCCKWFRHPSVKRVLTYETLSETNFSLDPKQAFHPNVFVDIHPFLDYKVRAMEVYASEIGKFPFPRSAEAIRSLARVHGSSCGCIAAEAFELLREIL